MNIDRRSQPVEDQGNVEQTIKTFVRMVDAYERPADDDTVQAVQRAIESVLTRYVSISAIEAALSRYKAARDAILQEDIPAFLRENHLSSIKMMDGSSIAIETHYSTSQKDKDLLAAWLEENGYDSIIKTTLAFGKGEFTPEIEAALIEHGASYSKDSNVHGQTLKATIKKHLEEGGDMPPEAAVEVKKFDMAVIKRPKKEGF